ncbi:hypothetical protein Sango_1527700 [Sesamum angolense]|uniref:GRF-type domain-containing protein n=1 Tax=Sesamum angolense TaxID=2727404 RepID=A0AAE1WP18_9LAMI|nr:hypothetical protein Sango_1527700 [Sesamum angolense]
MDNGHLGSNSAAHRHSTYRSNSTHTTSSSEVDILRICTCGRELLVRTSWTSTNPGRRFRGCPGNAGKYCRTFQWVDPPMCRRSKEIIPGLLNRLNQYENAIKRANETVALERRRRRRFVVLLLLCIFCWATTLFLAIHI